MDIKEISQVEQEIIHLLSQRDSKCLHLLYKHYSSALYGIILRIVTSKEIAEEVLQDVFLKFWKASESYDPEKSRLFTWLVNIARNAAIDKVRSARYKNDQKTDLIANFAEFNSQISESKIADAGLATVLNSLDEKYRKLIYLTYFQGYSQREISKEFDIPLGTVKTRQRDAIKMLRSKLDGEILRKLLFLIPIIKLTEQIISNSGY